MSVQNQEPLICVCARHETFHPSRMVIRWCRRRNLNPHGRGMGEWFFVVVGSAGAGVGI